MHINPNNLNLAQVKATVRGNWPHVLMSLGIASGFLTGRHGPCPGCGGRDRFRFDDRNGDCAGEKIGQAAFCFILRLVGEGLRPVRRAGRAPSNLFRAEDVLRIGGCRNFRRDTVSAVGTDGRESPNCQAKLRCPAVTGVQSAEPLLAYQLPRCLEEVRIVDRRVVRHIRQDRRFRATGHVRPGRVVVLAEFDE